MLCISTPLSAFTNHLHISISRPVTKYLHFSIPSPKSVASLYCVFSSPLQHPARYVASHAPPSSTFMLCPVSKLSPHCRCLIARTCCPILSLPIGSVLLPCALCILLWICVTPLPLIVVFIVIVNPSPFPHSVFSFANSLMLKHMVHVVAFYPALFIS